VAIGAAKDSVDTRSVLLRANGDVFALLRFHACLAVAGQACFILFERLGRLFLSARSGRQAKACQQEK
jgi:hypothetical protein